MKCSLSHVLLSFMLVVLVGCGFHLRGAADIPDTLKTMYVQGVDLNSGLGRELKLALTRNGVNVVTSYQDDAAVLTIIENSIERRVLSVGSDAKVSEYELFGTAKFTIVDSQGQALAEQQEVHASRDLQFDQDQVLGKVEEAQLLREQINQQMVQSILTRLSVLK
jgi:LPS-assembly lipoprotein